MHNHFKPKMNKLVLALFLFTAVNFLPIHGGDQTDLRNNFQYDWKCNETIIRKGNFPTIPVYQDDANVDGKKWTSVSKDQLNLLAHGWEDPSKMAGLYIKPSKPGPDNRIFIHLAASIDRPMYSPYPNISVFSVDHALGNTSHDHGKQVLKKGPFNCYIRRDIDFMTDVLSEKISECGNNLTDCLNQQRTWKDFQCVAGTKSPVCCYALFLRNNTEPLKKLEAIYGKDLTQQLKKCQEIKKHQDYKEKCPAKNDLTDLEKEKFYIFNKNISCNPFLSSTKETCLMVRNGRGQAIPCFGRCLIGMMINIEVTPTLSESETQPGTNVTIIQRYAEFNQKYYNAGKDKAWTVNPNEFGYDANPRQEIANHKIQVLRKKVNPLPLKSGEWNGIWIQWITRNPTCIHSNKADIKTPVLLVGLEGSETPSFEVDFACTNFEGDENDAMGWRYGWFGQELINPVVSSVWKPSLYAVNSLKGSKFAYAFQGNKIQCYNQRKAGPFPGVLIFAVCLAILLLILIAAICIYSSRGSKHYKNKRNL